MGAWVTDNRYKLFFLSYSSSIRPFVYSLFGDLHSRVGDEISRQQKRKTYGTSVRFSVAELLLAIVPLREDGRMRNTLPVSDTLDRLGLYIAV